ARLDRQAHRARPRRPLPPPARRRPRGAGRPRGGVGAGAGLTVRAAALRRCIGRTHRWPRAAMGVVRANARTWAARTTSRIDNQAPDSVIDVVISRPTLYRVLCSKQGLAEPEDKVIG